MKTAVLLLSTIVATTFAIRKCPLPYLYFTMLIPHPATPTASNLSPPPQEEENDNSLYARHFHPRKDDCKFQETPSSCLKTLFF
jgi:hypothetical protein